MEKFFDEKMLRHYIKRQISAKNSVIAALTYKFDLKHTNIYRDIYTSFIQGGANYSYANNVLNSIYDHIAENSKKKYTPYNYFDLDTLISFNAYLEHIIDETNLNRQSARRSSTSRRDFIDALEKSPKWLIDNAGTEETGYYNLNKTIGFLMQNKRYYSPEKTMSKAEFEKKYNEYFCRRELEEYIYSKHNKKSTISESVVEAVLEKEEDMEDDIEDDLRDYLEYQGKSYYVVKHDCYFDINMRPIRDVIAYCVDGRDTLIGTFDMNNDEYIGDLYDDEGNFKVDKSETGIDIIRKNYTKQEETEIKNHKEPLTKDDLIEMEDEEYYSE